MIKITTLFENTAVNEALTPGLGVSFFIEGPGTHILFDTGSSPALLTNADALHVDLASVEYVVLSHSHYDHTRGYLSFLERFGTNHTLFLHDHFFVKKYWLHEEGYTEYVGIPFTEEQLMAADVHPILLHEPVTEIGEGTGIYIMGDILPLCDFEPIDKTQGMWKNDSYVHDTFDEELCLVIPSDEGAVVLSGCSHRGVVNTCETVKRRFNTTVRAFIGGTHLIAADAERIEKTLDYFERENIKFAGVCHCTGEEGLAAFRTRCEAYSPITCGSVIHLQLTGEDD